MDPLLTADEINASLETICRWHHSIDLGHGIVSPGLKTQRILDGELASLRLPSLRGRTVLDIGAWDGFFSFEAERRGASRVVALDHYVWSVRQPDADQEEFEYTSKGLAIPPVEQRPRSWDPVGLPGKRGFDLARKAQGSAVEPVVADFMTMDLASLGTFDVVFYMGVLYHMRHPLLSLERLCQVTGEVAIIETEAIRVQGLEDTAFCEFYETTELNNDPSNWWAPNRYALEKMCRAAGFVHVDILSWPVPYHEEVLHYRLHAHAWKSMEARARAAHLYADLQPPAASSPPPPPQPEPAPVPQVPAPVPPVQIQAAPPRPPVPWSSFQDDLAKLKQAASLEYSPGQRTWRRFFTKPLQSEQGRFNRMVVRLLRAVLKSLRGSLEKRLADQERRLAQLERMVSRQKND